MKDNNNTPTLQTMPEDILSLTVSHFDYKSMLVMRTTSHHFRTPPPSICKAITKAFEEFKEKVPPQSKEELKKESNKLLVNFIIIAAIICLYILRNLKRVPLLMNPKEFFNCIIFGMAPSLFFFYQLSLIPNLVNIRNDAALAAEKIKMHEDAEKLSRVHTLFNNNKIIPHNEENQDTEGNLRVKKGN